jgi:hypothetical protein
MSVLEYKQATEGRGGVSWFFSVERQEIHSTLEQKLLSYDPAK